LLVLSKLAKLLLSDFFLILVALVKRLANFTLFDHLVFTFFDLLLGFLARKAVLEGQKTLVYRVTPLCVPTGVEFVLYNHSFISSFLLVFADVSV